MKKKFKLLLAPLALGLGVALVACGGNTTPTTTPTPTTVTPSVDYDALLRSLVIDQNGKTVSEDFDVPAKVQDTAITWTSSDETVVKFVPANDGKTVKAGIIIPTEAKTVTLKAKVAEGKEKEFKVKVLPIDVYSFMDAYKFPMASGVFAEEDVKFDTEVKITHKSVALSTPQEFTATVAFETQGDNANLVTVDSTNKKFVVGSSDDRKSVEFKATFTYGQETASKVYKSTVWHKLSAEERLTVFYDMVGEVTYDVYGYVLAKAGWNPSYNNGYLFIQDETTRGGFYIYRACMSKEVWDSLEFGTRVKASGMNSTNYNGLIETNGNVQVSVVTDETELPEGVTLPAMADADKPLVKAGQEISNYILTDLDQTKYYTGSSVRLDGWKVKEKTPAATTAKAGGDLLTLSKTYGTGDDAKEITIKVLLNKYAVDLDSDLATGIVTASSAIKVGDIVNVHGLLSNYNGWQLYAYTTDFVSAAETESAISEGAQAILAFEESLNTAVKPAFAGDKEVTLPAAPNGAEVSYELKKSTYTSVTLDKENNKLTVTPGDKEESVILTATLTYKNDGKVVGSKTYTKEFTTRKLNEEEQIAEDLKEIFPTSFDYPTTKTLPTEGPKFGSAFTWTLVDGADIATLENNVLTVNPTATSKTVKIGYTATNGNYTSAEGAKVEVAAQYAPTAIATVLSEKDTTKTYTIEAVVTTINRPGSSGKSVVLVDKDGGIIFSYDGFALAAEVEIGDKVVVLGKYSENNAMPQLSKVNSTDKNLTLITVISHNNDVEALLGTPVALDAATEAPKIAQYDSFEAAVTPYAGKYVVITGNVVKSGSYYNLYGVTTPASTDKYFNIMANDDIAWSLYEGKQVKMYGVCRGTSSKQEADKSYSWNKGYITFQAIKVELVTPAPNETTHVSAQTVELQLGETAPTKKITIAKTPWTTGDVTWTVASADPTKATVTTVNDKGEFTITGVAATDSVKITVTPSTGAAVEITVKVKAAPSGGTPTVPTTAASYTFDVSTKNYENGAEVSTVTAATDPATITFGKGSNPNQSKYYTSGAAIRCYGGNTITVSATDSSKKVVAIKLTFGGSDGSNEITASTGSFLTNVYNGETNSVVLTIGGTSGNRRITKIEVWVA
ncbi:MAG: hypothetical protein IJU60_04940 [Acholeplasmatales bacterium]|nr:hypothetical protein [Acholeplasmatales bacterium]